MPFTNNAHHYQDFLSVHFIARSFSQIFIFVPLHITFSWFAFQYAEVFLYFEFEYDLHHVAEPYTCYTIST